jgi:hypothetical protein
MPRLTLEHPHELDQDEAVRRLKEKFAAAEAEHGHRLSHFERNWQDHCFTFSFRALGMSVSGTVSVEPRRILLDAQIPFAAMLMKRSIEDRLHGELNTLLRS